MSFLASSIPKFVTCHRYKELSRKDAKTQRRLINALRLGAFVAEEFIRLEDKTYFIRIGLIYSLELIFCLNERLLVCVKTVSNH